MDSEMAIQLEPLALNNRLYTCCFGALLVGQVAILYNRPLNPVACRSFKN